MVVMPTGIMTEQKNTSTYYKDLNKDSSLTELKDFNDWANLKFNSNYGMMAFKGVNSNGAKSSMFMGEHGVIAEGVVNHNHKH